MILESRRRSGISNDILVAMIHISLIFMLLIIKKIILCKIFIENLSYIYIERKTVFSRGKTVK